MKKGRRVKQMSEWVKVTYELPEPYFKVLVFGDDGVFRAYRDDNNDFPCWQCDPIGSFAGDGCVYGITHWMDLPQPPSKK